MDKRMESETSLQQPSTTPIQCANKCGFFGTAATMNLCSKCYKDQQQTDALRSAVGKSLMLSLDQGTVGSPLSADKAVVTTEVEKVGSSSSGSNRCGCCNKKVGVVGFKCRCGSTFCGAHRYPEEHKCEFDYKVAGRREIAKDNPLVVADKLQKI